MPQTLSFKSLDLCNPTGPKIFQAMHSARLNNPSLKYQMVTPPDCKEVGIKQFEFVAKTQFLDVCFYLELLVR